MAMKAAMEATYQLLAQQRAQGLDDWQIFEGLLERERGNMPDFAPILLIHEIYEIYSFLDSEASHSANT